MTIIVRDVGSVPRTLTGISARDEGNVLRDVSEIWARDSNGVPRLVFSLGPPLSAAADPETVGGVAYGSGTVNTNPSTATATGGTLPYTYAWAVISHSNVTSPTIDLPTAATTSFTQTGVVEDDYAVFRCTITDDVGATATADVTAFFQNVTPP
jgi:hypothetical protein